MQDTTLPKPRTTRPVLTGASRLIISAWPVWLGTTLAGALMAALAFWFLPPWYEAVAVVKIGQVDGKAVEPPIQTIERMRLDSFVQAVGLADGSTEEAKRRLAARLIRGAELVEVRYRERSKEAAAVGAQKIVTALTQRHQELAAPLIQQIDSELQRVSGMQRESSQRREMLAQELRSSVRGPIKDEYPYLQLAFVGQDQELAQWEAKLRTARSAPNTDGTRLIEAVSVTERPVSPRPSLIGVGVIAGLLLGLAWSWFRARPEAGAQA